MVTIGRLRAAYARPGGPGPFAGVVVLHDIAGLSADTQRIAQRLADAGYAAVAPDLYSGGTKAICIAQTVLDMVRGGRRTDARVEQVRAWLAAHPDVGRPVGVIGFCMGGGFAMTAAVRGDYGAASVNYGRVPKSVDRVRGVCPVVGTFAGDDRMFRDDAERLERFLTELGVDHDVEVHPGVGHGFMNDHRGTFAGRFVKSYDEPAAEAAWGRILAFFARHL